MRFRLFLPCLTLAAVSISIPCQSDAQISLSDLHLESALPWSSAGNGATNDHWSTNEFILSPYTMPYVNLRWMFTAADTVQGTPTVEGNAVYIADNAGDVYQLNAATGKPNWTVSLPTYSGDPMAYSRNAVAIGTKDVILGDQDSATLYSLSKTDGSLLWKVSLDTAEGAFVTSSAVIVNGVVYVGVSSQQETLATKDPNFVPTFRGSVVALDEKTGTMLWKTYDMPAGYTGGAVWESNLAVDTARNAVFVTTGNNYSVPASVAACQTAAGNDNVALDACLSPDDHVDSVLSLNMKSGAVNWSQRFTHADTWTTACESYNKSAQSPCPTPTGLDTDFGAGPNLFTVTQNGAEVDAVGAGQKSGAYFTMNRDTGAILWGTQVGPDGVVGGIQWGTATDNQRIYVPNANSFYVETTLIPSGVKTNGGFWSALDKNTGQILWQTPSTAPAPQSNGLRLPPPPAGGATATVEGSLSIANGVVYGEDSAGTFVALDAVTGKLLRSFNSGGAGTAGPAISDGVLYWTSGDDGYGPKSQNVYAFWVGLQ